MAVWRSRTVGAVLLSSLVAPMGVPLVSPALPVVRDAFGLTDATVALLVSAYFLPGVVLAPAVGTAAERLGPRRVLPASLVAFGATGGAIAAAETFPVVLALRIAQGVAATGVFVTAVVVVAARFEGAARTAALGWNVAALSAGAAVYPTVGGALAGVAWDAPFLVYLFAVPAGAVAWVGLAGETARSGRGRGHVRAALGGAVRADRRSLYLAAFLTDAVLVGAVLTTVPLLLAADFDRSPLVVGAVLSGAMAASFALGLASGRLARGVSNRGLVAAGHGCFALGMATVWAAGTAETVAVGAVVHGAGAGLSLPAVDAALSDLAPPSTRAGVLGLRVSTSFAGRTVGPVAFALAGSEALLGGAVLAAAGALAVLARP
jgi:MFS family permease